MNSMPQADGDVEQRLRQVEGDNRPKPGRQPATWPEDRVTALRWRVGEWIARVVVIVGMFVLSAKCPGPWFGPHL